MSKKKRIGIIGSGNISHFHMMGYRNLENVEVVAACDIDEKITSFCRPIWCKKHFY